MRYITLGWKGLPRTNTLAYWDDILNTSLLAGGLSKLDRHITQGFKVLPGIHTPNHLDHIHNTSFSS